MVEICIRAAFWGYRLVEDFVQWLVLELIFHYFFMNFSHVLLDVRGCGFFRCRVEVRGVVFVVKNGLLLESGCRP